MMIVGCGGDPDPPTEPEAITIAENDISIHENNQLIEQDIQVRHLDNCNNNVETKATVSREQSVTQSSVISGGGKFGAALKIIEAAVEAKYENTRSDSITSEDNIELIAPPGTNKQYTVIFFWVVYSGDVTIRGEVDKLGYQYRQLKEVSTKATDLGCGVVNTETGNDTQNVSNPSPEAQTNPIELEEAVSQFLGNAIQAEIDTYTYLDNSIAATIFSGQPLENIKIFVETLRDEGLYYIPEFDFDNSYYNDIREVSPTLIEVDTCEYWSGNFYLISDKSLRGTEDQRLLPQTITIEYIGDSWYITNVEFYDPPSFCQ